MDSEANGAPEGAAEQVDSRLSMEEQMGAVFDKMQESEAAEAAAEREATAEPEEIEETEQEETQQAETRPRGPDGKFIAKDKSEGEEEEAQTESAEEGTTGETAKPSIPEAPTSWSAAAKSEWSKLPPAIQQEVLKREGDIARGLADRANRLKSYEPIEQALEPVRQMLDLNGIAPAQYVQRLVAAEQYLQKSPAEAIQYLAKSYGVDLQGLTQQQAEAARAVDPALAAVQQELQSTKQQQQQLLQSIQEQQIDAMQRQIDAFKADPKRKHFDAVYEDMVLLAQSERQAGRQPTLEGLYEKAVWANPAVREQILAEQKAEQERKAAEDKAKRLKDAKRNAGVNLGTQGASGQTPSYGSLEEELAAIHDRIQGAA